MTLKEQLAAYSKMVEDRLMTYIQPSEDKGQAVVFEACRYSAMAGGVLSCSREMDVSSACISKI